MILSLLAALAAQTASATPPQSDESRFQSCVGLVRTAPQEALQSAAQWLASGGGIAARQCLGLAHVELGQWHQAATVYEAAAREADAAADPRRGDLWVQAGNSLLAAGDAQRAITAFDAALLAQGISDGLRGEIHLDKARAQVALDNPAAARIEIDRALILVPGDPFGWYLSAALARRENDLMRARRDIERAVQLGPDDPNILLLAGTLAGLRDDAAEAERLYRQVVQMAPDSPAGEAARESLATIREVEVPATPTPPDQSGPE